MKFEDWGEGLTPEGNTRLYASEKYFVLKYKYDKFTHLVVRRKDWKGIENWQELQDVKNSICGEKKWAYEVYPSEEALVSVANSRHLWVFDEPFPFGYRERLTTVEQAANATHKVDHS